MRQRDARVAASARASVAAKAADDSRRALAANKADLRARELRWHVARVADLRARIDATLRPRFARRERLDPGRRHLAQHAPRRVFVSYACHPPSSFEERAFLRALVAGSETIARARSGDASLKSPVWLDRVDCPASDLGDDTARGLWRAEAAFAADAIVILLSPAYERCDQCALERRILALRRAPIAYGGDDTPPLVVVVDATPGSRVGPALADGTRGAFAVAGLVEPDADVAESPVRVPFDPSDAAAPAEAGEDGDIDGARKGGAMSGAAVKERTDRASRRLREEIGATCASVVAALNAGGFGTLVDDGGLGAAAFDGDHGFEAEDARDLDATARRMNAVATMNAGNRGSVTRGNAGSVPLAASGSSKKPNARSVAASVAAMGGGWRTVAPTAWTHAELDAFFRATLGGVVAPYLPALRREKVDGWAFEGADANALENRLGVGNARHAARLLEAFADASASWRRKQIAAEGFVSARSSSEAFGASGGLVKGGPPTALSDACSRVFFEADGDSNGFLDRWEMRRALAKHAAALGLDPRGVRVATEDADDGGVGRIGREAFAEAVVKARTYAAAAPAEEKVLRREPREEAPTGAEGASPSRGGGGPGPFLAAPSSSLLDPPPPLRFGLRADELAALLRRVLVDDSASDAELDPEEMRSRLSASADFGACDAEIADVVETFAREARNRCRVLRDGRDARLLPVAEFVRTSFERFGGSTPETTRSNKTLTPHARRRSALRSLDALAATLDAQCATRSNRSSTMSFAAAANALCRLGADRGVGVSRADVCACLVAAPESPLAPGRVSTRAFARSAAETLWRRLDPRTRRDRERAVAEAVARNEWPEPNAPESRYVRAAIESALRARDPARTGAVTRRDGVDALDAACKGEGTGTARGDGAFGGYFSEAVARGLKTAFLFPKTNREEGSFDAWDESLSGAGGDSFFERFERFSTRRGPLRIRVPPVANETTPRESEGGFSTRNAPNTTKDDPARTPSLAVDLSEDLLDALVGVAADAELERRTRGAVRERDARVAAEAAARRAHAERESLASAARFVEAEARAEALAREERRGRLDAIAEMPSSAEALRAAIELVDAFVPNTSRRAVPSTSGSGVSAPPRVVVSAWVFREGSSDVARTLAVVDSTRPDRVGRILRAWEGDALWPCVGLRRVDLADVVAERRARREEAAKRAREREEAGDDATPEASKGTSETTSETPSKTPSKTRPVAGVAAEAFDARTGTATFAAPFGGEASAREASASEEGPTALFSSEDAPRGFLAVEAEVGGGAGAGAGGSEEGFVFDDAEKALVVAAAGSASAALARLGEARARERRALVSEAARAFEADEAAREARRVGALEALEERRAAAAAAEQ